MKRQQKLTFFIEKRTAVEPPENDEEGPEKDSERWEESSITITTKQTSRPNSFSNYHNCSGPRTFLK